MNLHNPDEQKLIFLYARLSAEYTRTRNDEVLAKLKEIAQELNMAPEEILKRARQSYP